MSSVAVGGGEAAAIAMVGRDFGDVEGRRQTVRSVGPAKEVFDYADYSVDEIEQDSVRGAQDEGIYSSRSLPVQKKNDSRSFTAKHRVPYAYFPWGRG